MSKLHNIRGRITYISSHAKQENLYAVYETTDRHYWTELARFNQQEFHTAQRATDTYQKECAKWEETYGEKATPKAETMHEKLQRYQEKADRQNANQPYRGRDTGAR